MAAAKKAARASQVITRHDHIKELRNRFFVVAIVFVVISAVAYNYKDTLLHYLLKPLNGEKLVYLNPAGGFSFIFQVTMYVGLAAAIPFLVYNLYKFIAPALPESARKHSGAVLISSLFLLIAGVGFGYIFAIPGALNFLNNFGDGYITPNLTADSYLNFILAYTAGLGILFQLPLVLLLIHWVHPLKPTGLFKFERYMILIAFVGAAMITPTPDVMNQTVIALPIIIMYQIGVVAVCISVFRAKRRARPVKQSRAQIKEQMRAAKHIKHATPMTRQTLPDLTADVFATVQDEPLIKTAAPAAQAVHTSRPARPRYRPDIMGPVKKPVHAAVTKPQLPTAKETTSVQQPSQARKSMDIMMTENASSIRTQTGVVPHADRPAHHRQPALQVPQRAQGPVHLVDGISIV